MGVSGNISDALPWTIPGEEVPRADDDTFVHRLIHPGLKHLLVSPPKAGKSYTTLAMCAAIRNGTPFLGLPTEPTNILYLTEEPASPFLAKLRRFGIEEHDPGFRYLRYSAAGVMGLPWADIVGETKDMAIQTDSEFVVVDVLHRWAGFADEAENRSGAVSTAIGELNHLTEDGVAVLILHHSPHDKKRARGSGDIMGAVDALFYLDGIGADVRTLEYQGGRLEDAPERIAFRLDRDGLLEALGHEHVRGASRVAEIVTALDELDRPATTADVAEHLDWQERTTRNWLDRAYKHRLIARDVGERAEFIWRRRRSREYLAELGEENITS